ncbi:hypothetical protein BDB01DRAFT_791267 [Pilobolus umbonatus]|nr:hypothetical protein BDB01DRAFT_791267 [Pilobolus umbonatus]
MMVPAQVNAHENESSPTHLIESQEKEASTPNIISINDTPDTVQLPSTTESHKIIPIVQPAKPITEESETDSVFHTEEVKNNNSNKGVYSIKVNKLQKDVTEDSKPGGIKSFESKNMLSLPNGGWIPSCKHVHSGYYCLGPDGKSSAIVECSGENIGFQYSCGSGMLCYANGPVDVDCRKR